MKTIVYFTALLFLTFFAEEALSQQNIETLTKEQILAEGEIPDVFARKKFRYGVNFNSYWSNIKGSNLPDKYFWKPALGIGIRAEYYIKPFIGLGTGVEYQQAGAGVINPDNSGGAFSHPWIVNKYGTRGDPDSTHLEKLRFNNIQVPLTLLLRTPKDVFAGWRLSGSVGLVYMKNVIVNDIWNSIVDGFHQDNFVTKDYIKTDIGYTGSIGFDIDSGSGNMFQCHFVYLKGTKNVYAKNQGDGRQVNCGIRFAWLF